MSAAAASAAFDCNADAAIVIKASGRQASKVFRRIVFRCCSRDCDDQVLHVLGWRIVGLHALMRMVVLPAIVTAIDHLLLVFLIGMFLESRTRLRFFAFFEISSLIDLRRHQKGVVKWLQRCYNVFTIHMFIIRNKLFEGELDQTSAVRW
jgi:hypothetical protein